MISTKAKKLFTRIIRLGHRAGFSTVDQEDGSDKLVRNSSKIYQAWLYVQMGMILLYQAFLCYQVVLIASNPESPTTRKIRILSITVAYIILNCNHAVCLFRADEYVSFVNGYRRLMQKFIDSDQPCGRSIRFMKTVSFISLFGTFTNMISVIFKPTSPHVLTSLASNPTKIPFFPNKLAAAVFQMIANGFHLYAFCLGNSTVYSYSHDMTLAVGKLTPPTRAKYTNAVGFVKSHREFSILQAHFGALYANWIALTEVGAQAAIILNVYLIVAVRAGRPLVIVAAIGFGFWTFLEQTAEVYQMSRIVFRQWKTNPPAHVPDWFSRALRSCRHIYVPVGRFFYADKRLVLTVCSIIINASASLVLAK